VKNFRRLYIISFCKKYLGNDDWWWLWWLKRLLNDISGSVTSIDSFLKIALPCYDICYHKSELLKENLRTKICARHYFWPNFSLYTHKVSDGNPFGTHLKFKLSFRLEKIAFCWTKLKFIKTFRPYHTWCSKLRNGVYPLRLAQCLCYCWKISFI
jgi:hypothetical protein